MSPKKKNTKDSHVTVRGGYNVSIGGDITGSTIITGDQNTVQVKNNIAVDETDLLNASRNRKRLLDSLSQGLDLSEVSRISFELGIDYDLFTGGPKITTIVSLIDAIQRRGLFPRFLEILKRTRPDIFDTITRIVTDDKAG